MEEEEADGRCPAPKRMIQQFAHVLFDEPSENTNEVEEELDLSVDDILRARDVP